jgi:hypothetical protein
MNESCDPGSYGNQDVIQNSREQIHAVAKKMLLQTSLFLTGIGVII